jgi:NADPH:quinone reductase-like Zn-dependent oxidoreductase
VVRPVVGKVVGFDETPQALQSLSLGGIRGKAVMGKN